MFNRRLGLITAGALVAASSFTMVGVIPNSYEVTLVTPAGRTAPVRKRRLTGLEDGGRWKRSRGKQAKPRKRHNMRTVSKRVRRRHRRAA